MSSPTQGFGPLRDNTEARPLIARVPIPLLRSTLRLSQPFGGFLRSSASRALFHPAATFRVPLPSRGFLPSHSRPSFSEGFSPLPLLHHPLTGKPAATGYAPRLRGFAPCEDTCLQFGVYPPCGRSPLRVAAPPGLLLPQLCLQLPGVKHSWCLQLWSSRWPSCSPSAFCHRGSWLVCLQTANLLELFSLLPQTP